jgi:hypothetical protein
MENKHEGFWSPMDSLKDKNDLGIQIKLLGNEKFIWWNL